MNGPSKKKPRSLRQQQNRVISQQSQRQYSHDSSATEAQRQRILIALRAGPKTSFELRRLGIYQHSVRIFELRKAGHTINTARISLFDHDGFEHRNCALYSLNEPEEGECA
ncbi:MAG: helix-turn-helix domain-containing protein [Hydrogenophaga sp.]|nr:helix-turn-helix domain-containing protein [Hydrogenophaga sp.]